VAGATIAYDRTVKAPLYARNRIRELWILDLSASAIEIYRTPRPEGFQSVQSLRSGSVFAFQAFPRRPFAAEQLLADAL